MIIFCCQSFTSRSSFIGRQVLQDHSFPLAFRSRSSLIWFPGQGIIAAAECFCLVLCLVFDLQLQILLGLLSVSTCSPLLMCLLFWLWFFNSSLYIRWYLSILRGRKDAKTGGRGQRRTHDTHGDDQTRFFPWGVSYAIQPSSCVPHRKRFYLATLLASTASPSSHDRLPF